MNPLVSIIIPVYNAEKYIAQSISTVFAQTYKEIEVVIVNDGSTDRSKKIIEDSIEKAPPHIKTAFYTQRNNGPAAARNYGVERASGSLIAFLDADDYYGEEKVEKQVEVFRQNVTCDVVYNDVQQVDETGIDINVMKSVGSFKSKEDLLANMMFRQFIPAPASIMLRRECFDRVMYDPSLLHAEDYDFTLRLAKVFTFIYAPSATYYCRRHGTNLSNDHQKQQLAEIKIIRNLGVDYISSIINQTTYSQSSKDLLFAKIMMKIDEYKQAEDRLSSLILKERTSSVCFYLGNIAYDNKEYKRAAEFFMQAIGLDSENAEALNNLGCCYRRLGEEERAIHQFKDALALRPNYMDAMENLHDQDGYRLTKRELRKELLTYR